MTLNTSEIGNTFVFPSDPGSRSVRLYCGSNSSLRHAFWRHRRTRVDSLFSGGTSAEQEVQALEVLLRADSGAEARYYLRKLTWDRFDDDFEEQAVTRWAQHVGIRHAQDENLVGRFVRASVGSTTDMTLENQRTHYRSIWSRLSLARRQEIARGMADGRVDLIMSALRIEMLERSAQLASFRTLLEVMADDEGVVTDDLRLTRWQAFYAPRFAQQLRDGEVGLLVTTLGDLVDADLPDIQRQALVELYRMLEPTTMAIRVAIVQLGNPEMVQRYRRFLETRVLFLDNFPASEPTPGLIQSLMEALEAVGDQLDALRNLLAGIANEVTGITMDGLFNGVEDDQARKAINELAANRLADLPVGMRIELCRRCLVGSTDDDDEQAVHQVLANTRSLAERYLMVSALTWEALDFSFDGDEYDRLEELLTNAE